MRKIKVAFFAENLIDDFDGASRTVYQILNRIPYEEFEFMYFCGVAPNRELNAKVFQFPAVTLPNNKTYKAAIPYFSKSKMWKALDDFQPDVIHFTSPSPMASYAKNYGRERGVPVISIYHTHYISYVKYYLRGLKFFIPSGKRLVEKITYKFYNNLRKVYVPTQEIIRELKEAGLHGHNLKLWQRGLDNDLFNPNKKDTEYMRSITGNDKPVILFASRFVWEKNLQALIDLYKLYEAKGDAVNFVIAGDGMAKKELEAAMPKAHFLGMVGHEQLARLYASSDVFFFPSDTETYGNVVVEAMASGTPCVAANGGGPKSYLKHEETAFLCEANDITAYRDTINMLLSDKQVYYRTVQKGLEFTKSLNWDDLVDVYFEDLRDLVRSKNYIKARPVTPVSVRVEKSFEI